MSNAGAGFVQGVKSGNQIRPKGQKTRQRGAEVEELSQSDIESGELDSDSVVIEELGSSNKIRAKKEGEKPVKVDLDNITPEYKRRLGIWFDESELEEMSKKEEALTGKKQEDISSVWKGIRDDVESHNERVRKRKAEKEKAQLKEFAKEEKLRKPVKELSGEQFRDLLQQGMSDNSETQEEELSEALQQIEDKWAKSEPDTSINTPELETEELQEAQQEWNQGVWAEFAKDLQDSDSQSEYITLGENKRKVKTQEEEMMNALRNPEQEPVDLSVEIESDTGDTVIAVVSKE